MKKETVHVCRFLFMFFNCNKAKKQKCDLQNRQVIISRPGLKRLIFRFQFNSADGIIDSSFKC